MQADVLGINGDIVDKIELEDSIFGISPNMPVLHESIVCYLANQRVGTKSALTRAEVSGGGCKPWRQKGTGHARQGSIRAPQWTHGGIVFAPKPRDFRKTLNKKVRRIAIKSAISLKKSENNLVILEDFSMDKYNTKFIVDVLSKIKVSKPLIVLSEANDFIVKSTKNIPGALISCANSINSYDVFYHKSLVICKSAVESIHAIFGDKTDDKQKVVA